jgi:uroporphyrinogen III methyltransferase/synthase
MAGGLAPTTPVAAVRNGTRPDQTTVRTTLGELAAAPIVNPAVIVVGDVAALNVPWFEDRPLFGKRIVVTRAREQASELQAMLDALGAQTIELPAIAIEKLHFDLPALSTYDWMVCSSANAVEILFDAMDEAGWDTRAFADVQIAAIGDTTADALAARGIRADFVPSRFVSETFVEEFPAADTEGRVLVVRPEVARDVVPEGLTAKGWEVEMLLAYRTVVGEPDAAALEAVRSGAFDAITFTSSSTVTNTAQVVGAWPDPMPPVISIGPATSETARAAGLTVQSEADPHTIDGVIAALLDALADGRG